MTEKQFLEAESVKYQINVLRNALKSKKYSEYFNIIQSLDECILDKFRSLGEDLLIELEVKFGSL
jgi:hypothetical protein